MSTDAVHASFSPLSAALFGDVSSRRAWSFAGWGIALGVHAVVAGWAVSQQRGLRHAPPPPLQVELAPPPQPLAVPTRAAPLPDVPRSLRQAPTVRATAAPPEPARAAALLTAKADPVPSPVANDLVDFTNDPTAVGFGSGVVAIGGKAQVGLANARPSAAPVGNGTSGVAPRGDGLTPASNLSRKPALGEGDPCRGYFPASATDDVATAAVMVTIGGSGSVSNVQLLSESPPKQGFGAAARACMNSKRFSPGLDRDGNPTATAIRVNIRFVR